MRAVLQRVRSSSVSVNGSPVGQIGEGLLVLLGVGKGDIEGDVDWMVDHIARLRMFEDSAGKMNLSVTDVGGAMLVVSQFTLFADTSRGRRPSFTDACEPNEARRLYELFCERSVAFGLRVERGVFAAHMEVALVNDGPVTLCIDSRAR